MNEFTCAAVLGAALLIGGCSSSSPEQAAQASAGPVPAPATATPRYRQGMDAVGEARQLTDLVNARQQQAMGQLERGE